MTCFATSTASGSPTPRSPATKLATVRSTSSRKKPNELSATSSSSRRARSPARRPERSATCMRASSTKRACRNWVHRPSRGCSPKPPPSHPSTACSRPSESSNAADRQDSRRSSSTTTPGSRSAISSSSSRVGWAFPTSRTTAKRSRRRFAPSTSNISST